MEIPPIHFEICSVYSGTHGAFDTAMLRVICVRVSDKTAPFIRHISQERCRRAPTLTASNADLGDRALEGADTGISGYEGVAVSIATNMAHSHSSNSKNGDIQTNDLAVFRIWFKSWATHIQPAHAGVVDRRSIWQQKGSS